AVACRTSLSLELADCRLPRSPQTTGRQQGQRTPPEAPPPRIPRLEPSHSPTRARVFLLHQAEAVEPASLQRLSTARALGRFSPADQCRLDFPPDDPGGAIARQSISLFLNHPSFCSSRRTHRMPDFPTAS